MPIVFTSQRGSYSLKLTRLPGASSDVSMQRLFATFLLQKNTSESWSLNKVQIKFKSKNVFAISSDTSMNRTTAILVRE